MIYAFLSFLLIFHEKIFCTISVHAINIKSLTILYIYIYIYIYIYVCMLELFLVNIFDKYITSNHVDLSIYSYDC